MQYQSMLCAVKSQRFLQTKNIVQYDGLERMHICILTLCYCKLLTVAVG